MVYRFIFFPIEAAHKVYYFARFLLMFLHQDHIPQLDNTPNSSYQGSYSIHHINVLYFRKMWNHNHTYNKGNTLQNVHCCSFRSNQLMRHSFCHNNHTCAEKIWIFVDVFWCSQHFFTLNELCLPISSDSIISFQYRIL